MVLLRCDAVLATRSISEAERPGHQTLLTCSDLVISFGSCAPTIPFWLLS